MRQIVKERECILSYIYVFKGLGKTLILWNLETQTKTSIYYMQSNILCTLHLFQPEGIHKKGNFLDSS